MQFNMATKAVLHSKRVSLISLLQNHKISIKYFVSYKSFLSLIHQGEEVMTDWNSVVTQELTKAGRGKNILAGEHKMSFSF